MTRRAIAEATPRIGARTARPARSSRTDAAQRIGTGVGPDFTDDFDDDFGRGVARR
ncbi:hypothetical protein GCM10025782_01850 [Pedococcus ginsenosidimutans]|uniref:Uncharacterized protein n=1 Tax=Pedococcus ginsenosidimutans TaxID=490570 RepID=A0ABP8XJL4_9MICO